MLGVNIHIVTPKPLFTHPDVQAIAEKFAKDSGSQNMITDDIAKGVKGANVIYTDVWVSMGENDWSERIKLLKPYTVNMKMMKTTDTPNEKDSYCFRRYAIQAEDNSAAAQQEAVRKTMKTIASMIESGNQVAITHGNGPHFILLMRCRNNKFITLIILISRMLDVAIVK